MKIMENKPNYKKPINKLAQIAARIALRSALNAKIATESFKLGGETDSVATPKAPQALNSAHEAIDAHYINRPIADGDK